MLSMDLQFDFRQLESRWVPADEPFTRKTASKAMPGFAQGDRRSPFKVTPRRINDRSTGHWPQKKLPANLRGDLNLGVVN
jgi:hypothetical protein